MANYPGITSLNLGNTFGAWYAKTNETIARLNDLKVGNITGGIGISASSHPSTVGLYNIELANNIAKDVQFNQNVTVDGNLTVNGVLNYSFGGSDSVSGLNIEIPANTGVTLGNVVFIDSTGKAQKALADDECTSEAIGIVVGFTGDNAQVATSGKVSGSSLIQNFLGGSGSLQKGVVYFLSAGVSGAGTTMEPDVTVNISKPVLIGLTADSGIILPYRGYVGSITGSFGGSTTVIQGVCGGVLSINGPNASLYANAEDLDKNILKQTGDLHSLNYLILSGNPFRVGAVDLLENLDVGEAVFSNYIDHQTIFFNKTTGASNSEKFSSIGNEDLYTTPIVKKTTVNNKLTFSIEQNIKTNCHTLFSTSGVTYDVWKLKNIKFSIKTAPYNDVSFLLLRSINRLGGTNYLNKLNYRNGGSYETSPVGAYFAYGQSCILLVEDRTFAVYRSAIVGNYQPLLNTPVLTPRIIEPKIYFDGVTAGDGDGSTAAALSAYSGLSSIIQIENIINQPINFGSVASTDTSSPPLAAFNYPRAVSGFGTKRFPIIYGSTNINTIPDSQTYRFEQQRTVGSRTYTWDFNTNIVGGNTGPFIGETIKGLMEGTTFDFNSPAGYTMDTSILGWNAQYGSISENLYLYMWLPPTRSTALGGNTNFSGTVFLEMSKYDINTQTELFTTIVPIDITQLNSYQEFTGITPTLV